VTKLGRGQLKQGIEHTTDLEAATHLLALELEAVTAVVGAEVQGVVEWRPTHSILDALVGLADVVARKVTRHDTPCQAALAYFKLA
jgi:hypothetical protein